MATTENRFLIRETLRVEGLMMWRAPEGPPITACGVVPESYARFKSECAT